MAETKVSLKLLIDTHGQRVLFAEAGKDFVDFLFGLLSLPLATVIDLLRKQKMVGSLENLYKSIENLNESYLHNQTKYNLLKPVHASSSSSVPLLLKDAPTVKKDDSYSFIINSPNLSSVAPSSPFGPQTTYGRSGEGGFVKDGVTYMVMDDLVVRPMSTISSITLLNKFNVKDVGALEEKEVHLGKDEAVKLLNTSMQSQKVLTDVFMNATS